MILNSHTLDVQNFLRFCQQCGDRSDWVQGAGGNASWKEPEQDTLWVKASGKWLQHTLHEAMFVPVQLNAARERAWAGNASCTDLVKGEQSLRPSIETPLHALLDRRFVLHLHPLSLIAQTLYPQGRAYLRTKLAASGYRWKWIDYVQPGNALAQTLSLTLQQDPNCSNPSSTPHILILANHGLVLAHDTPVELIELAQYLLEDANDPGLRARNKLMQTGVNYFTGNPIDEMAWRALGYQAASKPLIHFLATNPFALAMCRHRWVLYPDHAVFLGGQAIVCTSQDTPAAVVAGLDAQPVCVVVAHQGVYVLDSVTPAQQQMLECYAEIVARLPLNHNGSSGIESVTALAPEQVHALLNWEAEAYRQRLNRASSAIS